MRLAVAEKSDGIAARQAVRMIEYLTPVRVGGCIMPVIHHNGKAGFCRWPIDDGHTCIAHAGLCIVGRPLPRNNRRALDCMCVATEPAAIVPPVGG